MNHRLTSVSLSLTNNLFDRILDDIDQKRTKSFHMLIQNTSDISSSMEFQKNSQLKEDIIYQSMESGRNMIQIYREMIDDEQKTSFLRKILTSIPLKLLWSMLLKLVVSI